MTDLRIYMVTGSGRNSVYLVQNSRRKFLAISRTLNAKTKASCVNNNTSRFSLNFSQAKYEIWYELPSLCASRSHAYAIM